MVYIGEVLKNSNSDVDSSLYGIVKTGAIGLMATDAVYEKEEPMSTYIEILTLICQGYQHLSNFTGTNLYDYIMTNPSSPLPYPLKFDSTGVKNTQYLLYNIKNFAEIEVGTWDYSTRSYTMSEYSVITWPGFTTNVPNDKIPLIQLGLLYPAHDNNGNIYQIGTNIRQGFDLALQQINNDSSILSGYQIQPVYIDTFLLPQLAATNIKNLASFNILGFIGPHSLDLCEAYIQAENKNANPKPFVTYEASSSTLSNSINFPNLLQIIQPDSLQGVGLTLFIHLQGWNTIGVLYTNDDLGKGIYSSFLDNIGNLEVNILNSPDFREITYSLDANGKISQETKDSVTEALKEIVRNQIKIIIFLGDSNLGPEIAKQGYEKELYGSDYA